MHTKYNTVLIDAINISEWINIHIIDPLYIRQQIRGLSAPDERCWVNWRLETREGKLTKVPYMPNGQGASSTNPNTWSTYHEVVAAQDRFNGIGIVFMGSLLGIDIDHCLVNGVASHEITKIVERARTYTEISPSGTGLHLYMKLTQPMALRGNRSPRGQGGDYECYTSGRYFAVSSQPWTASYPLRTITPEEAENILQSIGYPWKGLAPTKATQSVTALPNDQVLLKKMFSSKNGAKIEALYRGDTSAFGGDESAADASLCSHLAFWTGGDASRTTSIWLASPLGTRSKTQERKDYQERTVAFAIQHQTESYGSSFVMNEDKQNFVSAPSFEFISDLDLLAMNIPSVEWQIESLFEKGTLNMLSAPSNQYKSWLVLRMALSVAHGLPLFDQFETLKSNVLIVNEEDGLALIKHRYSMLLQDGEKPGGIFFVIQSGRKINKKWAEEIIKFTETNNIQFVILDSLRALHIEKENDSDAMQSVMDTLLNLTRKGLTVLFTHHHRKGQAGMNGEQSDGGMDMARGSTAITAAVHGHITCQEKRTGGQRLIISQPKIKAAEKLAPFILNISGRLEPEERLSFDYAGLYDADMGASDAVGARLLLHFCEHKSEYFTRKRLAELGFATSAEDQTLRSALHNLVEKQQLESRKYAELSDADQKLVPGKSIRSNSVVYKFTDNP